MNETVIDTNNNSDNNSLPIAPLCYTERNGKKIPVFPYVIAFTGHREFAKPGEADGLHGYTEKEIKNQFKNELEELAKLWKKKSGGYAPLILLTGLAEGADQIVAQAALELKDLNVKVIAVLPMDCDTFELTIESENAQQTYRNLLKQVDDIYELPLENEIRGHEAELKNKSNEAEKLRQIQYRRQAEFISLHSHIHFVFWDGVIADSKGGGTSETVMFKLQGNVNQKSATNQLTFSSIGPVVQFLLPRNDAANLNDPLSDDLNWSSIPVFYWTREILRKLGAPKPDRTIMVEANRLQTSVAQYKDVQDVISRIGGLNVQSAAIYKSHSQKNEENKQKSWDALFGIGASPEERTSEEVQKIRDNVTPYIDSGTDVFIDHYVVADMLANKFREKTSATVYCYAIAFGLFILFSGLLNLLGVFSHSDAAAYIAFSKPLVYLYEAALIVSAGIIVFFSTIKKYHYKYHYSRAIAEALRIQIFWRIALLRGCISGFYRSHQIFKTEWIRATINSLDVLIPAPQEESLESSCKRIDFVKEMWIKGQQKYFTDNILKKRKTSWIDKFSNPIPLFILTLLALGSAPFWNQMQQSTLGWAGSSPFWHHAFIVVRVIIAIAVAVYVGLTISAQKPIQEAEANRYERELFPFDRAMLLLSQNTSGNLQDEIEQKEEFNQKQDILRQLGEEALAGNSDWLLSVVKRELSFRNIKLGGK